MNLGLGDPHSQLDCWEYKQEVLGKRHTTRLMVHSTL